MHFLVPLITHPDSYLKRQVISCFSHIACHSQSLAEDISQVLDAGNLIACLKDADPYVRLNTAECIRNIVKHNAQSAKFISTTNGPNALLEYIRNNKEKAKIPALAAISSMASFENSNTTAILALQGVPIIKVLNLLKSRQL